MRVLVTGASGFLGRFVCRALQARGWRVRALLRRPHEGPWDEAVEGSLPNPWPREALQGCEAVVHLAGRAHALAERKAEQGEYFALHVEGTRRLACEAARRGVRRFVFASSVKAAADPGDAPADAGWNPWPGDPYGASKRAAEEVLRALADRLEVVILRPAMIYGPTAKGNLPRMIRAIARGWFPPLPADTPPRSMLHVEDAAEAFALAVEAPEAAGRWFWLAGPRPWRAHEIERCIRDALGKSPPRWHLPRIVWRGLAHAGDAGGCLLGRRMPWDSDAFARLFGAAVYDPAPAMEALGWRPGRDLADALPEIIAHLRREGRL